MDHNRIKSKIQNIDVNRWWGDDFDIRFYLISQLESLQRKIVLDVGGGIGIICSEMNENNFRINLDLSFDDLKICQENFSPKIQNICASMTNLPFNDNSFDTVICSHLIEIAKARDIEQGMVTKINNINSFPTVEQVFSEISRVLGNDGIFLLTTPNNLRYKSNKLDYNELKKSLKNHFYKISLVFYNTYPKLSKKHRKLNMANVLPKVLSKILDFNKLSKLLVKNDEGTARESVSFFVKCFKN